MLRRLRPMPRERPPHCGCRRDPNRDPCALTLILNSISTGNTEHGVKRDLNPTPENSSQTPIPCLKVCSFHCTWQKPLFCQPRNSRCRAAGRHPQGGTRHPPGGLVAGQGQRALHPSASAAEGRRRARNGLRGAQQGACVACVCVCVCVRLSVCMCSFVCAFTRACLSPYACV